VKAHRSIVLALACAGVLAGCASTGMMNGSNARHVTLSGSHEVPAVQSGASGSGTVTVNPDHTVSADVSVSGMNATMAHIHQAAMGSNGKVIVPLTKVGENHFVSPPGAKLTEEQYEAYKAGNLYVNVHSKEHPAGEIRAQLPGS
jgi:hypothetical protein